MLSLGEEAATMKRWPASGSTELATSMRLASSPCTRLSRLASSSTLRAPFVGGRESSSTRRRKRRRRIKEEEEEKKKKKKKKKKTTTTTTTPKL